MRKKDTSPSSSSSQTPPFYNGKMDRKKEGVDDVYEILMMSLVCVKIIVLLSSTVQ